MSGRVRVVNSLDKYMAICRGYATCLFLFFAFILFLIAGTDLATYFQCDGQYGIIPDPLVLGMAAGGLAFSPWNPFLKAHPWSGIAAGAGAAAFLLAFRFIGEKVLKKEALGLGDVKMFAAIGTWMGWKGALATLVAGSLTGSAVSLLLIFAKKIDRRSAVPFGPFLAAGALIVLFYL